ncbi:OmpH family outer membrane protein [Falsihalocynthiibacter sp. S25ZX9]|uniref:OmpH family outer membrane protein n=1 Tax=Falsihalocynthiibacter sp. S25ZX9 TaxID=3240870 RepID=UPI00351014F3
MALSRAILAAICVIAFCGFPALAQSPDSTIGGSHAEAGVTDALDIQAIVQGSFVILDPERLYAESAFGLRIQEEVKALAKEIQLENGKLTRDLETEELRLLERRAVLSPDEFRVLADAFDDKVQGIRDAQERKGQELGKRASEGRQGFNDASLPILRKILRERNALGILDSRVILLPDPTIDITNEAILRVDQVLQDGKP